MPGGTFANKFADWMPKTVTVEPWDGTFNAEGRPNFSAPVTYQCRVESKVRMVRDVQGNDRASNTTLIVLGGPIDPHSRITMPADFLGPSKPPIINVGNFDDKNEFSHSEVYL